MTLRSRNQFVYRYRIDTRCLLPAPAPGIQIVPSDSAGAKEMRRLSLYILTAVLLTGCSNEPEYTDQQRACIAKQHRNFDAKQMSQCVNVCKFCMGGNTTTCTTSCNLKGTR